MNDIDITKIIESLDENSTEYLTLLKVDDLLQNLKNKFSITEEEILGIDREITLYIIHQSSKEQCAEALNTQVGNSTRGKEIIEAVLHFLEQNTSINTSSSIPSSVLSQLNQTFIVPATLAPIKRSYDETTPLNTSSSSAPSGIKSIDPYREIPEK